VTRGSRLLPGRLDLASLQAASASGPRRVLGPWYPLSRSCVHESARVGGFRISGTMQLFGPFAETRALILLKTGQVH
jgi:hypothetical protein